MCTGQREVLDDGNPSELSCQQELPAGELVDLQEEGSRETHEALGFPLQLSRDGLWQKALQRGKYGAV